MTVVPRSVRVSQVLFVGSILGWMVLQPGLIQADDEQKSKLAEEIAQASRKSVVVISSSDRKGDLRGIGSGFIVRSDGVIATNYHVIGDGRPFVIQLAGGKSYEPKSVLAVDRTQDLALRSEERRVGKECRL